MYAISPTTDQASSELQLAFNSLQKVFGELKLALKSRLNQVYVIFSKSRSKKMYLMIYACVLWMVHALIVSTLINIWISGSMKSALIQKKQHVDDFSQEDKNENGFPFNRNRKAFR